MNKLKVAHPKIRKEMSYFYASLMNLQYLLTKEVRRKNSEQFLVIIRYIQENAEVEWCSYDVGTEKPTGTLWRTHIRS